MNVSFTLKWFLWDNMILIKVVFKQSMFCWSVNCLSFSGVYKVLIRNNNYNKKLGELVPFVSGLIKIYGR